jgi:hypothetical protein
MKRILMIASISLAAMLVVVYLVDYLSVRYRIPRSREPLGSVKTQTYYAIQKKNGTTEFIFNDPEDQTCVRSLFPHLGYCPCWYLSWKSTKRIDS